MAGKTTSKTTTKKYYFARTAAMAAVLWNPDKKTAWAEFDKMGLFVTKDKEVAQAVLDAGYIQVTEKQIEERNLVVPSEGSPTANFMPGAPGRGYRQPTLTGTPTAIEGAPEDEVQGPSLFTDEFPTGPDPKEMGKRTLR